MQQRIAPKPQSRPRVVDVLAEGLSVPLARPWLLTIPVLIDVAIWIGVKIQPAALMNWLISVIDDASVEDSSDVISSLHDLGTSNITQLATLFVPSMLSGVPRHEIYKLTDERIWTPSSSGLVVIVGFVLVLAGALISMLYSVPIADAVLDRKRSLPQLAAAVWRAWYRMMALLVMVFAAVIAIAIPLAILAAIFDAGGVDLLPLFSTLSLLAGIALLFYGYFVLDAIVVTDVGPIDAIRYSAGVVHRNKAAALGFMLASLLLTTGIPEIAEHMLGEAPGVVIAVAVQALIATGAAAASFLFFVDRLRAWRPELVQLSSTAPAFTLSNQGESRT